VDFARKHARETDEAGAKACATAEDGRQWIWGSFAPEFRLMIAAVVGPRTLDMAQEVVALTKARVAGIPVFFSDGFTCSAALIAAFHVVTTFARTGKRGRPRQPRCAPHPDLVYGQLVKQKKQAATDAQHARRAGRRTPDALGLMISTALVERVNLTLRQALAPWRGRRPASVKTASACGSGVVFFQGLLQRGQTAHELTTTVATARAPTPWRDSSPLAGVHAGDGQV
jgi:IS1 family transposase